MLSTALSAPYSSAMSVSASMSLTFISGFVGVSTQRSSVFACIASRTASWSVVSTKSNVRSYSSYTCVKMRWVPPYTSSPATTWSPDSSRLSTVLIEPIPEENARPNSPPSSAARFASRSVRVGFPVREYS